MKCWKMQCSVKMAKDYSSRTVKEMSGSLSFLRQTRVISGECPEQCQQQAEADGCVQGGLPCCLSWLPADMGSSGSPCPITTGLSCPTVSVVASWTVATQLKLGFGFSLTTPEGGMANKERAKDASWRAKSLAVVYLRYPSACLPQRLMAQ